MPIEMVSPAYHFCCSGRLKRFIFHSGEGSTPVASPCRSMPVRSPKPKCFMKHFGFGERTGIDLDRKSTRLNSSHQIISYAVFCLKKKTKNIQHYYVFNQNDKS